MFTIFDKFRKYFLAVPLKNKRSQTITTEFSSILTKTKRKPEKIEYNRSKECYISIFQNFLKSKNVYHYSRFTDKVPSIAERVIRTIPNLLMKPVFLKGIADWLSVLPSVIEQYNNNKIHNSIKMTPNQASIKSNQKIISSNLQDRKEEQKP